MPFFPLEPQDAIPDYATVDQFKAFVGEAPTVVDDEIVRQLENAERAIDGLLGDYALEDNGLKLGHPQDANEKNLTAGQVFAVMRATCAQAEYRIAMGEQFFIEDQFQFVAGPDFQRRGELARVGPKVASELLDSGFKAMVPVA